jgi:hypothetical protein
MTFASTTLRWMTYLILRFHLQRYWQIFNHSFMMKAAYQCLTLQLWLKISLYDAIRLCSCVVVSNEPAVSYYIATSQLLTLRAICTSAYFRAMFLSDMAESNQSIISIEIVIHHIFMSVLEYLYTDDVDIQLDEAMELFVAADLFGIPQLQSMCERKLL